MRGTRARPQTRSRRPDRVATTVALINHGCKLNQSEGEGVVDLFVGRGYIRVPGRNGAAVTIVNTCAVTTRAEFQCRQALRQTLRRRSDGLVVATGCYAQLRPNELASVGAHLVVGNSLKEWIPALVQQHFEGRPAGTIFVRHPNSWSGFLRHTPSRFGSHTRAFLKIQEGCDLSCTFCTVRHARGRSRSLPLREVAIRAKKLVAGGHREVVLTGVNLASYGRDLSPSTGLADVLGILSSLRGLGRIRLGSLEPHEVDRHLLEAAAHVEQFCPHFHLPVQSGSPKILAQMGRRYRPDEYRELVREIIGRWPTAAIGADLIAGFPGETAEDFGETVRLVEQLPLGYLHVFPYSPRKGTRASRLESVVAPSVRTERAARLRVLGALKKQQFTEAQLGTTAEVLLERTDRGGVWDGLTRNYVRVRVRGKDLHKGQLVSVALVSADDGWLTGCPLSAN